MTENRGQMQEGRRRNTEVFDLGFGIADFGFV